MILESIFLEGKKFMKQSLFILLCLSSYMLEGSQVKTDEQFVLDKAMYKAIEAKDYTGLKNLFKEKKKPNNKSTSKQSTIYKYPTDSPLAYAINLAYKPMSDADKKIIKFLVISGADTEHTTIFGDPLLNYAKLEIRDEI